MLVEERFFQLTMELTININNTENIQNIDDAELLKIQEVVTALIASGGLTGVRGGQTILHFDANANFMGVQLSYWPWKRRKQ